MQKREIEDNQKELLRQVRLQEQTVKQMERQAENQMLVAQLSVLSALMAPENSMVEHHREIFQRLHEDLKNPETTAQRQWLANEYIKTNFQLYLHRDNVSLLRREAVDLLKASGIDLTEKLKTEKPIRDAADESNVRNEK